MADPNNMPLVSVVLPVHNGAQTIERAIASILSQTFRDWELVVVDDGSTDHTSKILKSIRDPRVKIFSIPHSGIAKVLNYGIRLSRGLYIARMDADDISLAQRLERQADFLEKNEHIGLVSCKVEHVGDTKRQYGYHHYVAWTNGLISTEDMRRARFQDAPFSHPSVMFRKSIFFKHGGYSEASTPEDFELWLRWYHKGVQMAKIPEVLLKWYDMDQRLSRTSPNYYSENFFKIKAKYLMLWLDSKKRYERVLVFGSGRIVNKRLRSFQKLGIGINGFIDVKEKPTSPKHIYYKDLPKFMTDKTLILSFVSDRKGKALITKFLNSLDYQEGLNYLMMA